MSHNGASYQPPAAFGGAGSGAAGQHFEGGYLPSSQSPGRGGFAGGSQREERQKQSLIPVTCRQILELKPRDSGSHNTIFSQGKHPQQVTQVSLVAQILSAESNDSRLVLQVDDGSASNATANGGGVQVFKYLSSTQDLEAHAHVIKPGTYVRVTGSMPFTGENSNTVLSYTIAPVVQFDELTCHYLDALHWHLRSMHGPRASPDQASGSGSSSASFSGSGNSGSVSMFGGGGQNFAQLHLGANDGNADDVLSPLQKQVLDAFLRMTTDDNPDGVFVQQVLDSLPGVAQHELRQAIDKLCTDGLLYSTIDDDHFAAVK